MGPCMLSIGGIMEQRQMCRILRAQVEIVVKKQEQTEMITFEKKIKHTNHLISTEYTVHSKHYTLHTIQETC